jgi:hypothetical protein
MKLLWDEVRALIDYFSGLTQESSATLIAMLKCLPELSLIFGVDRSDFLIQQCLSGINRKDFKVRI